MTREPFSKTDLEAGNAFLPPASPTYGGLFDSLPGGFAWIKIIKDDSGQVNDYIFLEANRALVEYLEKAGIPGPITGKSASQVLPSPQQEFALERLNALIAGSGYLSMEIHDCLLGPHFEAHLFMTGSEQCGILFHDISHRIDDDTERQANQELLKTITENMTDLVITLDRDGYVTYASPSCQSLIGYMPDEMIGRFIVEFLHPDDQAAIKERYATAVKRRSLMEQEFRCLCKDGSYLWMEASGRVIRDIDGRYQSGVFAVRDISMRKRTEEELNLLNQELEKRVRQRTEELESFSYSVSHDLRAPLRAIDGFSRILRDEYHDRLDSEGQRLLDIISENVNRMGKLIDDLLAFFRLSRQEVRQEKIIMAPLIEGVLDEIRQEMANRDIVIEIIPMPPVFGDRAMLKQLYFNLLSNAVKFTRVREQAHIQIGHIYESDRTGYFFVKDNGTGFDMAYANKLFQVFQRLHRDDEFEGSGVGLAITKRIVERHGGKIWAESTPGRGSIFCFTIPTGE